MSQTLYMPGEAADMMKIMCERVDLSIRAGGYILSMARLKNPLPGGLVDMVQVAQAIKYASENQEDLKPQFRKNPKPEDFPTKPETPNKANFTFLK